MKDPIEYLFCRSPNDGPEGYTVPGWYFWDETFTVVYGPYGENEIRDKLEQYVLGLEL